MTAQDKDTVLINIAQKRNTIPPPLNLGAIPVSPTPLESPISPISQQQPNPPDEHVPGRTSQTCIMIQTFSFQRYVYDCLCITTFFMLFPLP
jgi:hypothetical protein